MYRQRPRILLADDHPMILEDLKGLLNPNFEVVGTTTDGRALLEVAVVRRPDLVLVDISMPEIPGIEATRRLHDLLPETRVLIFSLHIDPEYVQAAFAAGACGFLTKTSAPEEIERAIREVLAGRFYVSPEITRAPPLAVATLTRRELDTLRLVAKGLGNQQIARWLGVGVTTVRTHLNSLYGKLRLKSRVELALYASQAATWSRDQGAETPTRRIPDSQVMFSAVK